VDVKETQPELLVEMAQSIPTRGGKSLPEAATAFSTRPAEALRLAVAAPPTKTQTADMPRPRDSAWERERALLKRMDDGASAEHARMRFFSH
jgi:hypothetical protein